MTKNAEEQNLQFTDFLSENDIVNLKERIVCPILFVTIVRL